jgi:hypothetical protein
MRGMRDLFKIDWHLDFWDMLGDVSLQRLNIDRLSHGTGHCKVCRIIGNEGLEEDKGTVISNRERWYCS